MPKPAETKSAGLRQLTLLLEKAVDTGADSVHLEYADGGLEVWYMLGNTGVGDFLTNRDLIGKLIQCIVSKAKMKNKLRGRFQLSLRAKEYTIVVEEGESFGEATFSLSITKPKGKKR